MFKILEKESLAPDIFRMKVYAPRVAKFALPGQFVIVINDKKGERIPLTICDYNREAGWVVIVVQVVGASTKNMILLNVGDSFAGFVGPLGQPSWFVKAEKSEILDKNFIFVAGGVGAAPVLPQIKWLSENVKKPDLIIGSKSAEQMILLNELKEVANRVFIATDNGSAGEKGFVTDILKRLLEENPGYFNECFAIGPMIMMKVVSDLTRTFGLKTTVSLNTMMIDGTGMCGACRVTVGGKTKFTCVDGPEFDGHQVDFKEAMRRQGRYRKEEDESKHKCNIDKAVEDSDKRSKPKMLPRVPVREQAPDERKHNFNEVSLGYNEEEALLEASRCLNCKKPQCVTGCPVNIDIPGFINSLKKNDKKGSAKVLFHSTMLPSVCGRVCPQETQCEGKCILGIKGEPVAIGKLERFIGDWSRENKFTIPVNSKPNGHRVAVIGSGPAGLTCAGDLAGMGYDITIFEALHKAGGVLVYGIPEFRLPKDTVVKHEVDNLRNMGVKIITDAVIGKAGNVDTLLDEGFDAVFIGTGAGLPVFMNIPGENLNGVLSANEFLTRINLMKAYDEAYATPVKTGQKVAVVGGGNVAMDAARAALRLGAEVSVIYRRSAGELPARAEEVHHAREEGVNFLFLTNPVEVIGDENGWAKELKCVKMELGEPDQSGRRRPVAIPDSEFLVEADTVIMSLGTSPNPLIAGTTPNLETDKRGCVKADANNGATSRVGVFAAGDVITGSATVILAMGAARKAARAIDEYIKAKHTGE
ncbi:MAG: bifunctional dihydroorotate dehydrogenase B NAD binding subunit/NADPH-dependent glutamate synthase [Bacteroidales bacterium]|nr:bifunctional dihydroorotate dehydrogenase B NAD binding subunit/NADPH-dependent glutamate synthase [Bacteroidales bacterium]